MTSILALTGAPPTKVGQDKHLNLTVSNIFVFASVITFLFYDEPVINKKYIVTNHRCSPASDKKITISKISDTI